MGAALPYDDATRTHPLTTVPLHAEPVGIAIPAVSARSHAFLMCHQMLLGSAVTKPGLKLDFSHSDFGEFLAMSLFPAITLTLLTLEDDDLAILAMTKHLGFDGGTSNCG